jgi:hypothetical protein
MAGRFSKISQKKAAFARSKGYFLMKKWPEKCLIISVVMSSANGCNRLM